MPCRTPAPSLHWSLQRAEPLVACLLAAGGQWQWGEGARAVEQVPTRAKRAGWRLATARREANRKSSPVELLATFVGTRELREVGAREAIHFGAPPSMA